MTQAAPNSAPLPNSTYARATELFEAWIERSAYGTLFSRKFARLKLAEGRTVIAGTINPHVPKRTIATDPLAKQERPRRQPRP